MRSPRCTPANIRRCLVSIKNQSGEAPTGGRPAGCSGNTSEQTATRANAALRGGGGGQEIGKESSLFRTLQSAPSCNFSNDVNVQQAEGATRSLQLRLLSFVHKAERNGTLASCSIVTLTTGAFSRVGGLLETSRQLVVRFLARPGPGREDSIGEERRGGCRGEGL